MIDYSSLIADGYVREEYRICEIFFVPTLSGYEHANKKSVELQKAYEEYKRKTGDACTFTFLHKAEFDNFGNRVNNKEFTEGNMLRQKEEYKKMMENNPFIKTLTPEDIEKLQWSAISSYEKSFHTKMTRRLD